MAIECGGPIMPKKKPAYQSVSVCGCLCEKQLKHGQESGKIN